jgi:hypothetical protein
MLGSVSGRDAFFVVDLAANGEAFGADGCGRARDQMIDIGAVLSAEAAGRILLAGGNESERVVGWFGGGFGREPGRLSGAAVADEYLGTGDQVGHVGAVACAKGAGAGEAGDPFADVGVVDTKVGEDLGGDSVAFSQDSEQQVLAAGVHAVVESGFLAGVAEHFLRPRGECQRAGGWLLRSAADDPFNGSPGFLLVGASTGEDPRGDTVPGGQQAEQDVLGAEGS